MNDTSQQPERPIPLTIPGVRAALDGGETQVRCVIAPQPDYTNCSVPYHQEGGVWGWPRCIHKDDIPTTEHRCPYGKPGDRLWLQETWRTGCQYDTAAASQIADSSAPVRYVADASTRNVSGLRYGWGKIRANIHMPQWASRFTLEVTDVRVERLRDIEDKPRDAWAAGCRCSCMKPTPICHGNCVAFRKLWNSINAKRGFAWKTNPWVWVGSLVKVS